MLNADGEFDGGALASGLNVEGPGDTGEGERVEVSSE